MYGKGYLSNAAEAFLKDLSTGELTFMGCTVDSSINKTIEPNDVRCGISAGLDGIWYTNPDVTITVATGGWNDFLIQTQNDEDWATAQTVEVPKYVKDVTLVTSTTDGTYDITGTPVDDVVYFQDKNGKKYPATYATGTVTVTGGAGLTGTIMWMESVSTANTLDFNTYSLPKAVGLVLHHVMYDNENNVLADVYFEFPKVVGTGELDLAMTLNNLASTSVTLRGLPVADQLMKQIYVERA